MSVSNASEVVDFDADAALDAVRERVEGQLYAFVEYDGEAFNPLYVDEAALSFYEDREQMAAHFERIHSYVHVDFTEIEMFTDTLFPLADRVAYITTAMDYMTFVRVYDGRQGVFLALEPDEPVQPLVDAIEAVVAGD